MYARADLARYAEGLKALRNAVVLRTGGAQSRPGTQYLGTTKSNGVARLVDVVFDTDAAYVLEFGNTYVRFWKEGALVTATVTGAWADATPYTAGVVVSYSGTNYVCLVAHTSVTATNRPSTGSSWQSFWYALSGTTYELPTPYLTAQLFELQVAAQYNVLTIVHPDHEPATLTRISNNVWDLVDIDFATASGFLAAPVISLDPDEPGETGVSWMATVAQYDGATLIAESLPSSAEYSAVPMGNEGTVNTALAADDRVIQFDTFPSGAYLARIYRNSTGLGWRYLTTHDPDTGDFTDDGTITETPDTAPPSESNTASFASAGNFPSVVGAYQQRLLLAATDNNPDIVYASKVADPDNFGVSTPIVDSDSLSWRQVGSPRMNRIRHFAEAARTLWQFSEHGEFLVQGSEDALMIPGSPNPRQYSANGSAATPEPLIANDSVLYVQARGGIVRDLFPVQSNGFAGSDLTLQSAHLVNGYTIADWTYQQTPNSVIWAVRSDGELLSLTYVRELGILGWAQHDTDGLFKSVACVPESNRDAVYAVVQRTINSSTVRYVERFYDRLADDPILMDSAETIVGADYASILFDTIGVVGSDQQVGITGSGGTAAWTTADNGRKLTFVKGAIVEEWTVVTNPSGNVVTIERAGTDSQLETADTFAANTGWYYSYVSGFAHLATEAVSVTADGAVIASPNNDAYDTITVSASGIVNPGIVFAEMSVGLPYVTDIQTLDLDTPGYTVKDSGINITRVGLWLNDSCTPFCGQAFPASETAVTDATTTMYQMPNETAIGGPLTTDPISGYREATMDGMFSRSGSIAIRHIDPTPLEILAIIPQGKLPR